MINTIPNTDKSALICFAVDIVKGLRNTGISNAEIESILKKYCFSDLMIEQIMY